MRKWTVLILMACLLVSLCACDEEVQAPPGLEFRNIPWNSTPEAVFETLGMEMGTRSEVQEGAVGSYFTVTVPDWKIFGETAVMVGFRFYNFTPETSDHFGLSGVQIFYPMDCDQKTIVENLRRDYGPEAQEYTLYTIWDGQPEAREYQWEAGNFSWFSRTLAGDVLSDSGKAPYCAVLGDITDEGFEACLAGPAARIVWCEDYYGQFENPETLMTEEGNVSWLNFDGMTMVMLRQKFESEQ